MNLVILLRCRWHHHHTEYLIKMSRKITTKLTTNQIHRILSRNESTKKLFQGVYPYDILPRYSLSSSQRPALIVVNLGSSHTDGTHWTMIYFPKSKTMPAYYFDSLGNGVHQKEIESFIKRNSKVGYAFNDLRLQHLSSSSCSHFIIAVSWLISRGVPPENIHHFFFKESTLANDTILREMLK